MITGERGRKRRLACSTIMENAAGANCKNRSSAGRVLQGAGAQLALGDKNKCRPIVSAWHGLAAIKH